VVSALIHPPPGTAWRVGADENGLGARLGPLVVTAVLAEASPEGLAVLSRAPRGKVRADLGDSKRLLSHADVALGEAWARVLTGERCETPSQLFEQLSLEGMGSLQKDCPSHITQQCWGCDGEAFESNDEQLARIRGHVETFRRKGVEVRRVLVATACTQRLNLARQKGHNRFISDLHAMESLLLALRTGLDGDFVAVCGKVGGMSDYDRFFGPLSGRLRSTLVQSRARSAYYFPAMGEVQFVRDADAKNPLVMLASLVGKYVRELLMARIARFHGEDRVSGYHDPRTSAWVEATAGRRRSLRILDDCFERARDMVT
jgi:ribonuclease HII